MDLSELNNLELSNIGSWPLPAKVIIWVLLFAAALGAAWHFDWQNQYTELEKVKLLEDEKLKEFEVKQKKAANLEELKKQLALMEEMFDDMISRLPTKIEVESFVRDISQTGAASALEFQLVKPEDEKVKEEYVELPISLKVVGDFHEFGMFVSGIAALPRIVTLRDFAISRGKGAGKLSMSVKATTYRYRDKGE